MFVCFLAFDPLNLPKQKGRRQTHLMVSDYKGKVNIPGPSDEGPMLETLDYTIRIGSTPTFLLGLPVVARVYVSAPFFFSSMSRHVIKICNYIIAIGFANLSRANVHAPLSNRSSDMFAFPHFLRKLSKLAK